ncbi:hypothetical protein FRC06_002218, partial [Ceratobasidium sp. 370]
AAATTLAHSIYGYKVQSSNDSFTLGFKEATEHLAKAALPSNFLVNLFPALVHVPDWFPGTNWKRTAREWREQQEGVVDTAYQSSKTGIVDGEKEPAIIASLLNHAERHGLDSDEIDDYVKYIAATLFVGGTDTSAGTLLIFVLAMLLFPEAQLKVLKEIINTVVGLDRLPTMEDKSKLEYVGRLINEVLRWRPAVPAGVPHACSEDNVYRGYRIPKGAIVIGNIWAISHNPDVYEDPESFNPDRYLDPNVPAPPTFGFGRRTPNGPLMSAAYPLLNSLGVIAGITVVYKLWYKHTSQYPLPPSPRRYPLIGHLLSVPVRDEAIGFLEIGKQLNSDIFCLSVFGTFIVVLNSLEDTINLFEKRSSIYSDRVCPPMLGDPSLMDWGNSIALSGYNDRWRMYRRLIHPWLHKQAADAFHASQELQARLLLQRLLQASPFLGTSNELEVELYRLDARSIQGNKANQSRIRRTVAATIMRSIYGYKIRSSDDPVMLDLKVAADNGTKAALPSNFLVNLFPTLLYVPEWFPGAGWKRIGREWRLQKEHAIDTAYEWTKSQIAKGESESSIIASLLSHGERLGLEPTKTDDYVKEIASTLLTGGTDTTVNALLVFVLAMLLYPAVQSKAQEEIDTVVGLGRLPTMQDRANLDYVDRLVHEVLRWRPTIPTGIPHACSQDDVYRGYRIPKGTIVVGNIWAITRNETVYKDPETFDPDRYLDPEVPFPPTFGFGRRLCPGMHYAEASLFILVASVLATFDITLAKDEDGNDIIPVAESSNELI